MAFDIYVWSEPRDLEADAAEALIRTWQESGGDPFASPFEPTTDVGWFYRELTKDLPDVDAMSDGEPNTTSRPIWLAPEPDQYARFVGVNVPRNDPDLAREVLEEVFSLAVKYDVVVYEPARGIIRRPQAEVADYASSTFWPGGAIRTVIAIVIGVAVVVGAWAVGVPLVSGIVALFAAFMVAIFAFTLVVEGQKARKRRS
jgi:hypothetical protein